MTSIQIGRPIRLFIISLAAVMATIHLGFCQSPAENETKSKSIGNVEQAIGIYQEAQKDRILWEGQKSKLAAEYEQLLVQKQQLEKDYQALVEQEQAQETLNRSLEQQMKESIRVQKELAPFLDSVYKRLSVFIEHDVPFLKKERSVRLENLEKVLKDPEISVSEQYRKVMEALFIEAEYGSTIEVYQDTIVLEDMGDEDILGNILRLGRVSLFFLSLDNAACGVFDPEEEKWRSLPDHMLPAIRSAVEIGSKRRPVELLALPLGRLAAQGGGQ